MYKMIGYCYFQWTYNYHGLIFNMRHTTKNIRLLQLSFFVKKKVKKRKMEHKMTICFLTNQIKRIRYNRTVFWTCSVKLANNNCVWKNLTTTTSLDMFLQIFINCVKSFFSFKTTRKHWPHNDYDIITAYWKIRFIV